MAENDFGKRISGCLVDRKLGRHGRISYAVNWRLLRLSYLVNTTKQSRNYDLDSRNYEIGRSF
jgi:hypothetical protein